MKLIAVLGNVSLLPNDNLCVTFRKATKTSADYNAGCSGIECDNCPLNVYVLEDKDDLLVEILNEVRNPTTD